MLVAAAIAAARVRAVPRSRVVVAAVLVGLVLISGVQQIRGTGISREALSSLSLDLTSPVVETGASVRPLIEVVGFARILNEEPAHGSTYLAFPKRAIERALGLPRPDSADTRYAGGELAARIDYFQIGYSAVAEAFRNWGTGGVILVFALFGALLGWVDHRRLGRVLAAIGVGVVSYALLYHVRQSSNVILPTLIYGAVMVWFTSLFPDKPPQGSTHDPFARDWRAAPRGRRTLL